MKMNSISTIIMLTLVIAVPFLNGCCSMVERDQLQSEVTALRSQMGILQAKTAEELKQCEAANAKQSAELQSQAKAETACQNEISKCEKEKEQLTFELDKTRQDMEALMRKKGANMEEPSPIK